MKKTAIAGTMTVSERSVRMYTLQNYSFLLYHVRILFYTKKSKKGRVFMAKVEKRNGKWTIRVYHYTDDKGKIHNKRFTADSKKEVTALAIEFQMNRDRMARKDITVAEAVESYIAQREPVLSPSTVRAYRAYARNQLEMIAPVRINSLSDDTLQYWINHLAADHSPKYVTNVYNMVLASVRSFRRNFDPEIKLPAKKKPELHTPTSADVEKLLQASKGTELHKAILLSAVGTLRRGEIAALDATDLVGNTLTIRSAVAIDSSRKRIRKSPKTYNSYRTVIIPSFVADEIRKEEGPLVDMDIEHISSSFYKLVRKLGLPPIRFHDLRHYSASIMHALGIPDQYIIERGGWSGDGVMKRIYRNTLDDQTKINNDRTNEYFDETFAHRLDQNL